MIVYIRSRLHTLYVMLNVRVRTLHQRLLARRYHQKFNILYFGRDEFSCRVFEKLHNANGRSRFLLALMFS